MKKLLLFIMIFCIIISATACGSTSDDDQIDSNVNDNVNIESSNEENSNEDTNEDNGSSSVESEEVEFDISTLNEADLSFNSEEFTEGDYIYKVSNDNNYVLIRKYVGSDSELNVPEQLGGKPVVAISDMAFDDIQESLTKISIPDTVILIENDTFKYFSNLKSIDLPSSLQSIGDQVFEGCKSLTSVDIPASLKRIGYKAFNSCSSLTSVSINSVDVIESAAFRDCSSLVDFVILNPESCKTDSKYPIFGGCTSLDPSTLPKCLLIEYLFVQIRECFYENIYEDIETMMKSFETVVNDVTGGIYGYGQYYSSLNSLDRPYPYSDIFKDSDGVVYYDLHQGKGLVTIDYDFANENFTIWEGVDIVGNLCDLKIYVFDSNGAYPSDMVVSELAYGSVSDDYTIYYDGAGTGDEYGEVSYEHRSLLFIAE